MLRSLGKFFVLAEPTWLQRLRDHLGPWILAGPAQPPSLRLGLPGGEAHWARLEQALADIDRKGRAR